MDGRGARHDLFVIGVLQLRLARAGVRGRRAQRRRHSQRLAAATGRRLGPRHQPDYLGGLFGHDLGWTITALETERAMVLDHWGAFVLQPLEDNRTRFIIRSTVSDSSIPVWASVLEFLTFELPHFIMERRMMLTIKALAEPHRRIEASARWGGRDVRSCSRLHRPYSVVRGARDRRFEWPRLLPQQRGR
jgi:hypothetical protein